METIKIQKLNIIKEIKERDLKKWQGMGYKQIESQGQIDNEMLEEQPNPSKYSAMSDQELAEYAEHKGIDISRVRSREAAIAKLEKSEELE